MGLQCVHFDGPLAFVDLRFEGMMLHYANVSDMVLGREPEGGMVVQQPKVSDVYSAIREM